MAQRLKVNTEIEEGLPMPRRLWAVVSITVGAILYSMDGGIGGVAVPVIAKALNIESSSAVLLVSVYHLILAMTLMPLAALGERFGLRRVYTLGFVFYIVPAFACLFTETFAVVVFLRAIQALAGASLLSVGLAMIRQVYPSRMLGRGMGLNTMAASLGAALAPMLGGILLTYAPWQAVFAAGLPLAIIGLLASRALPDADTSISRLDGRGSVLCALTFGLGLAGLQALGEGVPLSIAALMMIGGICFGVWFVRYERRIENPVLPIDLLADKAVSFAVLSLVFAVLSSTILMLYLPFKLYDLGFDAAKVGMIMAPFALTVMVAGPTSGMLSDVISANFLGTIGLSIAVVGLASFSWLPHDPQIFDFGWRVALCGLGFSYFYSPNARSVIVAVSRDRVAGASSLLSTTRMIGQAVGSTGVAGVVSLRLPHIIPLWGATSLAVLALICTAIRWIWQGDPLMRRTAEERL